MTEQSIAPSAIQYIQLSLESHPYHKSCGLEVANYEPGYAKIKFELNEYTLNTSGFLHGGVLYGLLDVCGFAAAISQLNTDEQIVTHDFHCSVLSPVNKGWDCFIEANVQRRGSNIVFIRADAFAEKDEQRKKIALATVTKSVVKNRYQK